MNIFSRVLLFCSGVNTKLLADHCPHERHKFYPIGLGVITTTLLAFISMLFAANAIFGFTGGWQSVMLVLFSLFWAFAIFMIDWGLVKTMKRKTQQHNWWSTTKTIVIPVLFRLVVAIILSYSISRPLEVKIFEKRLKAQIERDRQQFVENELRSKNEKVIAEEDRVKNAMAQMSTLRGESARPPATASYKYNESAQKNCTQELATLEGVNARRADSLSRVYDRLGDYNQTPRAFHAPDSLGSRKMMDWAIARRREIRNISIPALYDAVRNKREECQGYANAIKTEQEKHEAQFRSLLDMENQQAVAGNKRKDSIIQNNNLTIEQLTRASYTSFDSTHPGLITQLESLASFERTPEGRSAGYVRLLLLLVIICIDTAPIVIKLLTKSGAYEMVEELEDAKAGFWAKMEAYSLNFMASRLSTAQKEIYAEAIKQWKNKEKNREDLSESFINVHN